MLKNDPSRSLAPMPEKDVCPMSAKHGVTSSFTQMFPAAQVLRYLIIGAGNTVFGYACYSAFVGLYSRVLSAHYLSLAVDLAWCTATLIGVTESFFAYKFLVFRTSGNYVREWIRCLMVYGSASIPGLFILPLFTKLLQSNPKLYDIAPHLAGALVMGGTAIYTYLAHKNFSFAARESEVPTL